MKLTIRIGWLKKLFWEFQSKIRTSIQFSLSLTYRHQKWGPQFEGGREVPCCCPLNYTANPLCRWCGPSYTIFRTETGAGARSCHSRVSLSCIILTLIQQPLTDLTQHLHQSHHSGHTSEPGLCRTSFWGAATNTDGRDTNLQTIVETCHFQNCCVLTDILFSLLVAHSATQYISLSVRLSVRSFVHHTFSTYKQIKLIKIK